MDIFKRAAQDALTMLSTLTAEIACVMHGCAAEQSFNEIRLHYRAAEKAYKEIQGQALVMGQIYESHKKDWSMIQIQKAELLMHYVSRSSDLQLAAAMNVYRRWLAENELINALRE